MHPGNVLILRTTTDTCFHIYSHSLLACNQVADVAANLGFVEVVSLLEDMVARNTATLLLLPAHMQAPNCVELNTKLISK